MVEHHIASFDCLFASEGVGHIRINETNAILNNAKIIQLPGGEVIHHHNVVAPLNQRFRQVRSDESGAAGDQYFPCHR
jgi:hypothetical protein